MLLVCGLQSTWGFVGIGPVGNGGDAWQVSSLGYGGIGAPKNIGEEYRRNTPVLYYAYDQNFSGFFGLEGETAVDGSFAVLNSLTNVSSYSASLSEFPLNSQSFNYTAQALGLTDLKSATLNLLVESMGLAEPDPYTWTLHDRYLPGGGACPAAVLYLVVQRNLAISPTGLNQLQYSPYVNGTLYSYEISESCPNSSAVTRTFAVDPYAQTYTSVASFGLDTGGFYGGLTQDDVAGLRYLLRANNINYESAAAGSTLLTVTTNLALQAPFPLTSSSTNSTASTNSNGVLIGGISYGTADLGALISASRTNDPTTLQSLFPGVIVATSSNYFILATNTVITSYYTNYNGETLGSPPHLIQVTNFSYYPLTIYVDTFANIITNHFYSNTVTKVQTTSVGPLIGAPGGVLTTNVTTKTVILTNVPSGDFYLIQPNQCPVNILYTLFTNVVSVTNVITSTTNNAASTNNITSTNVVTYAYSQSVITSATNYVFVTHPVVCGQITNSTGSYQGIENIKFIRVPDGDLDPLTHNFIQPITNNYTMVMVNATNSKPVLQKFQRIITTPDYLLTAQDLAAGPSDPTSVLYGSRTVPLYNEANVLPGLAGPGTIDPGTTFTYDKVGNIFHNGPLETNAFLSEYTQSPLPELEWASFDGTTNDPVVYPNGTSIQNIENQIFVQITPTALANGTKGVAYPATTFTATGGAFAPPFTWSQTGLPTGLNVSSGGTLSGTPTQSGTFDFTLQLTDAFARSVQWTYTIIIQ